MNEVIALLLGALVFALGLWGGIKIIDPSNTRNSPTLAAVLGLFFSVFGYYGGLIVVFLPLLALIMLLSRFYDLPPIQVVMVIVFMVGLNIAVSFGLAAIFSG